MESFPDDFAGVGNQDKCAGVYGFDIVSKPYCLMGGEDGKDDIAVVTCKGSLCLEISGAPA